MANFGFNLKQILFLQEFHNLLISLLSKHLLKHSSFFYNAIIQIEVIGLPRFIRVTSKMENTQLISILKMADPRQRMVPDPSFAINNVVMTSPLLFQIINVFVLLLLLLLSVQTQSNYHHVRSSLPHIFRLFILLTGRRSA